MARNKKDKSVFRITQFQPNNTVTCSSIMVEVDGLKILMDLGMLQDSSMNFKQLYHANMQKLQSIPFEELDYVTLLHAHLDHSAFVPILARAETQFTGTIIATELTADLGRLIMEDACRINQSEVTINNLKEGKKYRTYYDKDDVPNVMDMIRCYSYNQEIRLSDTVTLELLPACHMSGASMAYITYHKDGVTRRLLYTSDITYGHDWERPFTKRIVKKCLKADVVIMESTYGLRNKTTVTNGNPIDMLEQYILEEVVEKNKTLWLPSFAVHRATTLYLYLNEIWERNEEIRNANIPVYFCGKMMHEAHKIIGKDKYKCYYDEIWHDKEDIFVQERFGFLTDKKDVEHFCLNNTRKIVISSAGMLTAGYSSLLADSYVANKKVSLVYSGYVGEGTLSRTIQDGEEYAIVNGTRKKIRAMYCGTLSNMSGHASHQGLINFVKSLNQSVLKNVILVHGDDDAKQELKEDLEKELSSNKSVHIIKQFETLKF